MKLTHHKDLTVSKWSQFSLAEQLANVGAEVGRVIKWRGKDKKNTRLAFERALELVDLTIADPENKGRLKEICRMREMLVDWYLDNEYNTPDKFWQEYFYQFNYLARSK